MDQPVIFHNPSCSKSRGALEILSERGLQPEVVEYLKAPPDKATVERIVAAVGGAPGDLVRKDKRFKELQLDAGDYVTAPQVVGVLLQHPELMERPVVFVGDRAVVARPSERVLELLEER
jgi:arsenate reductase (glutaredoxin)